MLASFTNRLLLTGTLLAGITATSSGSGVTSRALDDVKDVLTVIFQGSMASTRQVEAFDEQRVPAHLRKTVGAAARTAEAAIVTEVDRARNGDAKLRAYTSNVRSSGFEPATHGPAWKDAVEDLKGAVVPVDQGMRRVTESKVLVVAGVMAPKPSPEQSSDLRRVDKALDILAASQPPSEPEDLRKVDEIATEFQRLMSQTVSFAAALRMKGERLLGLPAGSK